MDNYGRACCYYKLAHTFELPVVRSYVTKDSPDKHLCEYCLLAIISNPDNEPTYPDGSCLFCSNHGFQVSYNKSRCWVCLLSTAEQTSLEFHDSLGHCSKHKEKPIILKTEAHSISGPTPATFCLDCLLEMNAKYFSGKPLFCKRDGMFLNRLYSNCPQCAQRHTIK